MTQSKLLMQWSSIVLLVSTVSANAFSQTPSFFDGNEGKVERCCISIGTTGFGDSPIVGKMFDREQSRKLLGLFKKTVQCDAPEKPDKWYERAVLVFECTDKQILRVSVFEMAMSAPKSYYISTGLKFYSIRDSGDDIGESLIGSLYEIVAPGETVEIELGR